MKEMIRIMIVEDDKILAKEIREFLKKWGYDAELVTDFSNVMEAFEKIHPHLVLLDINLPFYDGLYWCRQIRQISEVPIIYISSRNDDRDKIMAIAQGGDDFMEKPFHLELMKVKIEAILRRAYQYKVKDRIYLNEELYFEYNTSTLFFQDREIDLTKSEKKILASLMEAKPQVVTRETLMQVLWNTDEFVSDSTLTTVICRLRGKLDVICPEGMIQTKKGQGYYIK
ncbi:MAG: response regulator transcription factor [Hespellia sp.]|nr:response regulator transcription factor [Hespellia sp.]